MLHILAMNCRYLDAEDAGQHDVFRHSRDMRRCPLKLLQGVSHPWLEGIKGLYIYAHRILHLMQDLKRLLVVWDSSSSVEV
jgi:hypothetical protein